MMKMSEVGGGCSSSTKQSARLAWCAPLRFASTCLARPVVDLQVAFDYLKKYVRSCGGECITLEPQLEGKPQIKISEEACMGCLMRAKKTPGDAVRIVNLPASLTTNVTHLYGNNGVATLA